jgi:hypothetical protein
MVHRARLFLEMGQLDEVNSVVLRAERVLSV